MQIPNLQIFASEFTNKIISERLSKYNLANNQFKIINLKNDLKFDKTMVKYFSLAHSIPGTLGFDFHTPDGSVVFMNHYLVGDLGVYGKTDLAAIKAGTSEKGILALAGDGSRSNFVGRTIDKSSIKPIIEDKFKN
jgi:ribonuclease J